MSLTIDDKVIRVVDYRIRRGVIRNVFDLVTPTVYAVEFDDGTIEKVSDDNLALDVFSEFKTETVIKSEVTITPDEFRKLVVAKAVEVSGNDIPLGLSFATFGAELAKALFEADND